MNGEFHAISPSQRQQLSRCAHELTEIGCNRPHVIRQISPAVCPTYIASRGTGCNYERIVINFAPRFDTRNLLGSMGVLNHMCLTCCADAFISPVHRDRTITGGDDPILTNSTVNDAAVSHHHVCAFFLIRVVLRQRSMARPFVGRGQNPKYINFSRQNP